MKARSEPSVLWREGMFLLPQHFQAFGRELSARIAAGDAAGRVGDHGLLALRVHEESLAEDLFRIEYAEVVFRDGTLAVFPGNGHVDQREFAEHFRDAELTVHLGVPAVQPSVPQIGSDADRVYRFDVDVVEAADENTRASHREIEFRRLQGRLFFGDEDRSGFDSLPIGRLVREGEPVARSVLSPRYVPPVLAVGASKVLRESLARTAERARSQARDLAARLPAIGSLERADKGEDLTGLFKLQALNQCVALLEQVAAQPALHPFHAHLALVQAAGSLAIFSSDRLVPELPSYDPDDLVATFEPAFAAVHELFVAEVSVPYDSTAFAADPTREGFFEVRVPRDWIEAGATFYLGVELDRRPEEVAELVSTAVKLLSPDDVERVLQGVVPGIGLELQRIPPLSFPQSEALHFFAIDTEGGGRKSWLRVQETGKAMVLSALGGLGDLSFHLYVELSRGRP